MASNGDASGPIPPLNSAAQAAQIAHSLRYLLMIMGRCVDSIRAQMPAGSPIEDDLAELDRSIDRTFQMTHQLLAIGRPTARERVVVDVNQLVRNAEGMIERALSSEITPQVRLAATQPHVLVNPYELEWVLLSLLIHCREAMPEGGRLTIETANDSRRMRDRGGAVVRLTVAEPDPEEPGERRDRPFPTPFDASDIPASRLRNITTLVENLGGWLKVDYRAGRATIVHVDLPAYNSSDL